jgi:hypothetical protein
MGPSKSRPHRRLAVAFPTRGRAFPVLISLPFPPFPPSACCEPRVHGLQGRVSSPETETHLLRASIANLTVLTRKPLLLLPSLRLKAFLPKRPYTFRVWAATFPKHAISATAEIRQRLDVQTRRFCRHGSFQANWAKWPCAPRR